MYYRYFISLELYSFGKNYKAQLASNELPKKKKKKTSNEDFYGLNSYFSL